jgi:hypothetical protein
MLDSIMDKRYELKFRVEYDEIFRLFKHVTLSPIQKSVAVIYYTHPAFSKPFPFCVSATHGYDI